MAILGAEGCSWLPGAASVAPAGAGSVASVPRGRVAPRGKKGREGLREATLDEIESEASRPRGGLQLFATLDKASYTLTEPIVLDIRLTNVTGVRDEPRDIPVYFEPFAKMPDGVVGEWLFKFKVRSEKDDVLRYHSQEFDVKEADRAKYHHYVILQPQTFVGLRFDFPPASSRRWQTPLAPGRYTVLVTYSVSEDYPYVVISPRLSNAQAEELGLKVAYVHVWTGEVSSQHIPFTIRKSGGWLW